MVVSSFTRDTYMNEGYIDDGFVGFPYFSMTLKLGTMREIPRNPRNWHLIEALGVGAHDNGPLFVYKDTYMNEGYIHDGLLGSHLFFCITLKLGTMREIPRNPRNSHFIEEA